MTYPPAAHTNDPVTSYEALAGHQDSGKRQAHIDTVLAAVKARPGMTAGEIGAVTGLGRTEAARRLTDLKLPIQVVQGPARRCSVQGTRQVTWWPW